MLRVVRRLFHAMFATPAAPVAADVSAASLFFKDLEERQQRRGLLRCLHAVCGTTADKCGHLPELRAHTVTKSRSHTGERESAVDRQARISDELVTGCVACTDSVLLEVIRNAIDIHLGLKAEDSYRTQGASVGSCFTGPATRVPPHAVTACPAAIDSKAPRKMFFAALVSAFSW